MPVLGGVVVPRGKAFRTLLKGVYVVDGETADQVQKLFVDSARFTGSGPPKYLKMSAGEIFYDGGKIAEVKLRGGLPLVKDEEWDEFPTDEDKERLGLPMSADEEWAWKRPSWSTSARPDFSWVDDLRLAFAPRDLGRPYVAALRIGGPILLWWDVASGNNSPSPAGADVRFIRIARPVKKKPSGRRHDRAGFEAAIRYAEELARSADEMRTLLKLLRDDDELEFIDQYRAFSHAFEPLLEQRIDDGATGRLRFSIKAMGEAEMRQRLVSAVAAIARDHLIIRPGRRHGSGTRNRNPKSKKRVSDREKDEERRKLIADVIMSEYKSLRRDMPAAEAESRITRAVVLAAAKIPKSTFFDWLVRIGSCFEDLKAEALRRLEN